MTFVRGLEFSYDRRTTVSLFPSLDPDWRFVDAAGHPHRGDELAKTCEMVVDRSHWCDGDEGPYNHDPHEAVDESHWECRECRETIKPRMIPPGQPVPLRGEYSGTVEFITDTGTEVRASLTHAEVLAIRELVLSECGAGWQFDRLSDPQDERLVALVDAIPQERWTETITGGVW